MRALDQKALNKEIPPDSVKTFLHTSEVMRSNIKSAFGLQELYFDFVHLVSRTAVVCSIRVPQFHS